MHNLKQSISIIDSCNLIKKSSNPFSPIKEAIANSIDSISQKADLDNSFIPKIVVNLYFSEDRDIFDESQIPKLHHALIKDNGIGFTSENTNRFKNLADTTKNRNNRGTGKIQFFCRFEEVLIKSTYSENSKTLERTILWKRNGDYTEENTEIGEDNNTCTSIELRNPIMTGEDEKKYFFFLDDNMKELKNEVYKFFLLRLWLEIEKNPHFSLEINSYIGDVLNDSYSFDEKTIIRPVANTEIRLKKYSAEIIQEHGSTSVIFNSILPTHSLKMDVFRVDNDLFLGNLISLCSKGIMIESFPLPFVKKSESIDGEKVFVCVYGSLFDDGNYINARGDRFVFPRKKDVEKEILENGNLLIEIGDGYYWFDEIKEEIINKVISTCGSIKARKEQQINIINEVGSFFHFSDAITKEVSNRSSLTDSEKEITERLFVEQAKQVAASNYSIKETYDKIKRLEERKVNPLDKAFNDELQKLTNKLLNEIPSSNKDELSRYIIHRDLVVDILSIILNHDLAIQKNWKEKQDKDKGDSLRKEPEGLLHDLIIRRKTINNDDNELWLFNEDFVHYDSCSDVPFAEMTINGEPLLEKRDIVEEFIKKYNLETSKNNTNRRPDVFLYPEEGKCIIIEFKSYEEEVTKYLDQIPLYAKVLISYSRIPIKTVYGYLIGSNIDEVRLNGWKNSIEKDYWTKPLEQITSLLNNNVSLDLYMELLDWKLISDRAKRRNNNFAKKLGIR